MQLMGSNSNIQPKSGTQPNWKHLQYTVTGATVYEHPANSICLTDCEVRSQPQAGLTMMLKLSVDK